LSETFQPKLNPTYNASSASDDVYKKSKESADFWKQKWAEFNPGQALYDGTSTPSYGQAADTVAQDATGLAGMKGYHGDLSRLLSKSRNRFNQEDLTGQANEGERNYFANQKGAENASDQGLSKTGQMIGMTRDMSEAMDKGNLIRSSAMDDVRRMLNSESDNQSNNAFGAAVGGFAGKMAGRYMSPNPEAYDPNIDFMDNLPDPRVYSLNAYEGGAS
jgi:hypothetical protein